MLTFEFTGVEGRMTESEVLTSGMVGKTVQLHFDDSWANLSKTVVFRADGICRVVPFSMSPILIPEDVLLRPFRKLYVGVYGTDASGTLVIPTVMAEGPMIRYGADPTEDSTAEDLPAWKKLRDQIGDLDLLETAEKKNLVAAINEVHAELQQMGGSGLSKTAAALLIEILRHAVYENGQSSNIDALEEALLGSGQPDAPVVTLARITAAYSGGSVPVGTSVNALTGITVTGHYSDGSSAPVTGYSLSGTIAFAGANTVAVIYSGLTAYFTVTGVAKTLTGITAVYTGGSVPVGTAVTALVEQVSVTASYDDGTSASVSGFSLTGQISNVGSNTVTVTYQDATATFTVTGTEAEVYVDHITATYTGGAVPVGTALTDLTGLAVTVVYSDGSSSATTRYTLSGQISTAGSNIITVSYSGKTATFTVVGVDSGSGETGGTGTLLHSWDYTQSLVDSVSGVEMVLTGATRDENGLHINTANDSACTTVNLMGNTAEIEFGEVTDGFSSGHGRAVTLSAWPGVESAGYSAGLIWHSTGKWSWYGGATVSGWTDGENANKLAISGGTVRIPLKTNKEKFDVTLNSDVLLSQVDRNGTSYLGFGSDKTAFVGLTVKKLRIYEGA